MPSKQGVCADDRDAKTASLLSLLEGSSGNGLFKHVLSFLRHFSSLSKHAQSPSKRVRNYLREAQNSLWQAQNSPKQAQSTVYAVRKNDIRIVFVAPLESHVRLARKHYRAGGAISFRYVQMHPDLLLLSSRTHWQSGCGLPLTDYPAGHTRIAHGEPKILRMRGTPLHHMVRHRARSRNREPWRPFIPPG